MRISFLGTLVVAILAASPAAASSAAEEEIEYPAFRVGVGVSLASRPLVLMGDEATAGSPASMANIQLPVYLGTHLRLEAEFGMHVQRTSLLPGNALIGSLAEVGTVHTETYRVLIGAAWAAEVSANTLVYAGPKFGLQTRSMELEFLPGVDLPENEIVDSKVKAVDYWLGAVVGGEAFLTEHFSLGLEVGFFYLNLGESALSALRDLTMDEREHSDVSPWSLSTHGSIAARLYFL